MVDISIHIFNLLSYLKPEGFRPLDDPEREDVSEGDHEVVGEGPRGGSYI